MKIEAMKNADRFVGFADTYENARPAMPFYPLKIIMQYLGKKPDTVIDLGCGTGRLALKTIPNCKHFTGIDISSKTIERAKENLAEHENKTLICADFLEYDFTQKFDVIYSSLTFLHIKEKQKAINKIAELLNNGGWVVLSLDKNQSTALDYGNAPLTTYPDTPKEIK